MATPTRLKYRGTVREVKDDAGNVVGTKTDRFVPGVPARDLDERDIAQLEPDVLKSITGGSDPLYVNPDAGTPKEAAKPETRVADKPAGKDDR